MAKYRLDDPDPLRLSPQDVADLTGLSVSMVKDLSDDGTIRCLRIPRGKEAYRKYRLSWVNEFIAAHTTGPAPAEVPEDRPAASFRRRAG